ncbi:MAG: ABC transporter substrate-binding protein [Firmicutes bacterium]|nr:ABC transporter substrate-binding protein [Bacillota bacterium]
MKKTVLVLFASALVLGLAFTGFAQNPEKVHLVMGYIPNVQFAPWYVALEKGFFQENGLELTMDYGKVNDVMRLLAAGEVDFAIAGGDEVIMARSQGIPVTYLAALYARFPAAIISLSETGITTPADLKGKSIGLPGFYGTNYIAIKAVLASAGLDETQVVLRPIGYTQVPSLTQGKVDAVVGFANNEPIQLRQLGQEITVIPADDYFDLVGHGVVAGEKIIKENPELVRKFVDATIKGMRYALDHPEETFEICKKYIPELDKTNETAQYKVLLESMKLWQNELTREKGLGYSDPAFWTESQQLMKDWGLIEKTVPASEVMTNEFLPQLS